MMSGLNEYTYTTNLADALSSVLERRGMKPLDADETAREIAESISLGIRVANGAHVSPIARNVSRLVDLFRLVR